MLWHKREREKEADLSTRKEEADMAREKRR